MRCDKPLATAYRVAGFVGYRTVWFGVRFWGDRLRQIALPFFFFYFKGRLGVFTLNLSGNGFDYVEELNVFTSYGEGSINELNISNDSNYELLKTFINYKNIIILRLDYFFLFVASSKKLWPRCFFMAVCVCVYVTVEIFLYGYITKIRNGVRKKSTGRMFRQDHNN